MKKALFYTIAFICFLNNLEAVDLLTHERAKIVEIDIVNDPDYDPASPPNYGILWQISQSVDYTYLSNPYLGEVNNWYYTDFTYIYNCDAWCLVYLNPDYPQFTYIWVQEPSYTPNSSWLQRGSAGASVPLDHCSNGYCLFIDYNSQDVTMYEMVTRIAPPEGGTVDLYNTVYFNRRNY